MGPMDSVKHTGQGDEAHAQIVEDGALHIVFNAVNAFEGRARVQDTVVVELPDGYDLDPVGADAEPYRNMAGVAGTEVIVGPLEHLGGKRTRHVTTCVDFRAAGTQIITTTVPFTDEQDPLPPEQPSSIERSTAVHTADGGVVRVSRRTDRQDRVVEHSTTIAGQRPDGRFDSIHLDQRRNPGAVKALRAALRDAATSGVPGQDHTTVAWSGHGRELVLRTRAGSEEITIAYRETDGDDVLSLVADRWEARQIGWTLDGATV